MSKPLKPRRGTTAEQMAFVGEAYEVTYDTDKNTLVCRDGLTAGGFPLQRADLQAAKDAAQDEAINSKISSVNGLTPDSNGNVDVGGMPLGTVFPYTGKDVPAGTLRADGTTYTNMRESFPEFYEWVVASGLTVPLGDYALVEGSCGYYGLDTSTGTVRMPTLAAGVFGTAEAGKYGQAVEAGLPNIVGAFADKGMEGTIASGLFVPNSAANTGRFTHATSVGGEATGVQLDASRVNPIYGNSDTVTPSHVKYPWVIVVYNAAVPPSVAEAAEFIEMLDGKENRGAVRSVNGVGVDASGNIDAVRLVMPDYSSGVSISLNTNYHAAENGWLVIRMYEGNHNIIQLYIDGVGMGSVGTYLGSAAERTWFIPIAKGSAYLCSSSVSAGIVNMIWYPCFGG